MTPIINIDEEGAKTRDEEVRVLVTGFGAWGKNAVNPSNLIVSSLPTSLSLSLPLPLPLPVLPLTPTSRPNKPTQIRIITHTPLSVAYAPLPPLIPRHISTHAPHMVLHVGLHGGHTSYDIEQSSGRLGYSMPDVDGERWSDELSEEVWPSGIFPDSLVSTFDVAEVQRRCGKNEGFEVKASDGVGRYLCGFVYYTSLANYESMEKGGEKPVLFLHTPFCPTQEDLDKGREAVIKVVESMVSIWLERNGEKISTRNG